MSLVKTQVQLPKEDLEALRRVAAKEGVSVSALVRRGARLVIDAYARPSREQLWERASRLIGKYDSGLTDLAERHDDYLAEAIEEEAADRWKSS